MIYVCVLCITQITIDILIEMNGDDLQSIGITAFGVRHRLLKRVRELVQGNNEGMNNPLIFLLTGHISRILCGCHHNKAYSRHSINRTLK